MRQLPACVGLALFSLAATAAPSPFDVQDLVRLERVSNPRLSPDRHTVAYQLRQTDLDANKGINGIWLLDLSQKGTPRRASAAGSESNTPHWGADGRLYFLSAHSGRQQLWRLDPRGGEAGPVTKFPLDIGSFLPTPDGRKAVVSMEVFADCADLACTAGRLENLDQSKARGRVFDKLFIRHWDTWANGTRAQLFLVDLAAPAAEPRLLTAGIDGDVPTKPFGDDTEYCVSPDGKMLYFTARIAGKTEPWSTNTDIWRVPMDGSAKPENLSEGIEGYDVGPAVSPDGKTVAWRSMKRGGDEADRYRIMVRDVAGGPMREVAPAWDRTATALGWSPDGRTLYTIAEDLGNTPLFAIDVKSGRVQPLSGKGTVASFDVGGNSLVFARDDLRSPVQLYSVGLRGGKLAQLTHHNEPLLVQRALGEFEQFSFKGANDDPVYGYVVKPANYVAGKKYPVALLIHGGPQNSFGNHFHYRWNPQTYAGAGYASVFIDFHGSTGYGQAFTDSISGDWGGRPLEDLKRGWAYALSHYDYLDGSRACALGASYGGYMVNWINGNWQDAFKCLVTHDGILDARMMSFETEELWFDEWENQGVQWERPENYERWNAINFVAKWKTPTLVIHGGLDYRIPDTQGIAVFTALQRRGIESRFLYFPNENHWVLKPANSIQWHETVQDWLKRWIGN